MWTVTTALYNTHHNVGAAKATIPLIFLFFFFYDIAYTPLIVAYALEILPFRVRAKGFAVMVSISLILGASFLTVYLELHGHGHNCFQPVRQSLGARSHLLVVLRRISLMACLRIGVCVLFYCRNQR